MSMNEEYIAEDLPLLSMRGVVQGIDVSMRDRDHRESGSGAVGRTPCYQKALLKDHGLVREVHSTILSSVTPISSLSSPFKLARGSPPEAASLQPPSTQHQINSEQVPPRETPAEKCVADTLRVFQAAHNRRSYLKKWIGSSPLSAETTIESIFRQVEQGQGLVGARIRTLIFHLTARLGRETEGDHLVFEREFEVSQGDNI